MILNKREELQALAKKYARAFLHIYYDQLTMQDYHALVTAADSLNNNKRLVFFWNLSSIDPVVKALSIEQICRKYNLNGAIKKLCHLLLASNRLFIIHLVLGYIVILYRQQVPFEHVTITSSHILLAEQITIIKKFIESKVGHAIIYTYNTDATLIAGVRIHSDSFLWEHSVAKDLRSLALTLIR